MGDLASSSTSIDSGESPTRMIISRTSTEVTHLPLKVMDSEVVEVEGATRMEEVITMDLTDLKITSEAMTTTIIKEIISTTQKREGTITELKSSLRTR